VVDFDSCKNESLELKNRLHSSYEKSIVKRMIEYLRDGTKAFDDYSNPCIKAGYVIS
jgi:hypothetical protein